MSDRPTPSYVARWMRIKHGRVMHAVEVEPIALGGWLRSKCRTRRGAVPGAYGPADDWSAERHWYPNCAHCEKALEARDA